MLRDPTQAGQKAYKDELKRYHLKGKYSLDNKPLQNARSAREREMRLVKGYNSAILESMQNAELERELERIRLDREEDDRDFERLRQEVQSFSSPLRQIQANSETGIRYRTGEGTLAGSRLREALNAARNTSSRAVSRLRDAILGGQLLPNQDDDYTVI